MLKVVVADDEKRICRLICMLADWQALGMEVVAMAFNGLEALDAVQHYQPDILITDIHMPGCNGLDLIAQVKEVQPNMEIIIISGYAHFDYAQSAVKLGVGEYLLKPIRQEELMASLRKLGQRCQDRRATEENVHTLEADFEEQLCKRREQFVCDLMNKQVENLTAEGISRDYQLEWGAGCFAAFVLKIDYTLGTFTDASIEVILEKARGIFASVLSPICNMLVMHFEKTEGCGILCAPAAIEISLRKALREAMDQLTAQRPLFGAISFSCGLGQMVSDIQDLPLSLKAARYSVLQRLLEGTGRLYEPLPFGKSADTDALLQRYRKAIGHAIDQLDTDAATRCTDQMKKEALAIPGITGKDLLKLVEAAGKMFILCWSFPRQEELVERFELCCRQSSSADILFDQLREMQNEQILHIRTERETEASRPIRIAKKYVQEHFQEPITLDDVSAVAGFSPSYFSIVFKKEVGEGFARYLSSLRIERAKELLRETNYPVVVICQKVGYSDVKHFVETFRKSTGLNPAQYRKLFG